MKTAVYCRVSTDNQEREGTSLKGTARELPYLLPEQVL